MVCVYYIPAWLLILLFSRSVLSWSARALEDGPGERQHLVMTSNGCERLPEIINILAPLQPVVHRLSMPAGVLIIATFASILTAADTRDRQLLYSLTNYHYAQSVELKTSQLLMESH